MEEETPTSPRLSVLSPRGKKKKGKRGKSILVTLTKVGNYNILGRIGKGGGGVVYKAVQDEKAFALKRVDLGSSTPEQIAKLEEEVELLRGLAHANIIQLVEAISQPDALNIIMELAEGGSVIRVLKEEYGANAARPEPIIAGYVRKVLEGLSCLHTVGIAHRDIKGENLLITVDGELKIADFGSAKRLGHAHGGGHRGHRQTVVGTPNWMAPEIINSDDSGVSCDIWSVGCTIIELVTGSPPWSDLNPMSALYKMVEEPHPPMPDELSEEGKKFLARCFERDPEKRVDAGQLLEDPWILNSQVPDFKIKPILVVYPSSSLRRPTALSTTSSNGSSLASPRRTSAMPSLASFKEGEESSPPAYETAQGITQGVSSSHVAISDETTTADGETTSMQISVSTTTTTTNNNNNSTANPANRSRVISISITETDNNSSTTTQNNITVTNNAQGLDRLGGRGNSMIEFQKEINRSSVPFAKFALCAYCSKTIKGDIITAMGKDWHHDHFRCTTCHIVLDGTQFVEFEGKGYCAPCGKLARDARRANPKRTTVVGEKALSSMGTGKEEAKKEKLKTNPDKRRLCKIIGAIFLAVILALVVVFCVDQWVAPVFPEGAIPRW